MKGCGTNGPVNSARGVQCGVNGCIGLRFVCALCESVFDSQSHICLNEERRSSFCTILVKRYYEILRVLFTYLTLTSFIV